jgi:putative oxidoreductase
MRFLDHLRSLGLLAMRIALGTVMIAHGFPKISGGLHNVIPMVTAAGFPAWMAYIVAATEFIGGIMILVGLLTRFVAFAMLIEMVVIIARIKWHNGFTGQNNYQFELMIAAVAFGLIFFGAGSISLDRAIFGKSRRTSSTAKKS